ncbi:MAG: hypothetical protein RJA36_3572 [Pseudomonadota bacterium]|jgi:hypothetical protein
MKLYHLEAVLGDKRIEHARLTITKATPIIRTLAADGWAVTLRETGEAKHTPPPAKPQPMSHPWKAGPAVPRYIKRRRTA